MTAFVMEAVVIFVGVLVKCTLYGEGGEEGGGGDAGGGGVDGDGVAGGGVGEPLQPCVTPPPLPMPQIPPSSIKFIKLLIITTTNITTASTTITNTTRPSSPPIPYHHHHHHHNPTNATITTLTRSAIFKCMLYG